jgi:uncharacterized membrane protein YoaK (UPF0700 family)
MPLWGEVLLAAVLALVFGVAVAVVIERRKMRRLQPYLGRLRSLLGIDPPNQTEK